MLWLNRLQKQAANGCIRQKVGCLPDGESNPGLPRDRRGYSPLYYRGLAWGGTFFSLSKAEEQPSPTDT